MAVKLNVLPDNIEKFKKLAEGKLTNPEHTCALFLCALSILAKDKDQGIEAINVLKGPQPLTNLEISWLADRISDKTYLANVYFEGATPENNYTPNKPYMIKFYKDPRPQDLEPKFMKLLVKNVGFDAPREFTLRNKGDNWYIWDINSIMMGVRTPEEIDPWA